ncbi:MAG: hypothetical protein J3R72DRAFT_492782 [Linnemannia gamsii]|nr:MAG: hypothetical protein J3R72DRAFT_492782 [Linnemannia gamsii]
MKLTATLLLSLACALFTSITFTNAAPIVTQQDLTAASIPQDLIPRTLGWQGPPQDDSPTVNDISHDKRDMGWQTAPTDPQEGVNGNNPWDVVRPDSSSWNTNPWDRRGDDSAKVDTSAWDKRAEDSVKLDTTIWGKKRAVDDPVKLNTISWGKKRADESAELDSMSWDKKRSDGEDNWAKVNTFAWDK